MKTIGPLWTLRRKKDPKKGEASDRDAQRSRLKAMTAYENRRRRNVRPSMPSFKLPE